MGFDSVHYSHWLAGAPACSRLGLCGLWPGSELLCRFQRVFHMQPWPVFVCCKPTKSRRSEAARQRGPTDASRGVAMGFDSVDYSHWLAGAPACSRLGLCGLWPGSEMLRRFQRVFHMQSWPVFVCCKPTKSRRSVAARRRGPTDASRGVAMGFDSVDYSHSLAGAPACSRLRLCGLWPGSEMLRRFQRVFHMQSWPVFVCCKPTKSRRSVAARQRGPTDASRGVAMGFDAGHCSHSLAESRRDAGAPTRMAGIFQWRSLDRSAPGLNIAMDLPRQKGARH